jgi:hypothetical protein
MNSSNGKQQDNTYDSIEMLIKYPGQHTGQKGIIEQNYFSLKE